jgi:hypothetical protein
MALRVAPWAFAAVYGIVAFIAIWGGIAALTPPAPPPSQFDPNPLPPLVNSGMVTAAIFYFVTALAFAAATAHAVLLVRKQEPLAVQLGLNTAYTALLAVIAAYSRDTLVEQFTEAFKDHMRQLYKNLEKEHDYLTSDEVVWESLEANEMTTELEEANV